MPNKTLIGPFNQILTLSKLPLKGALRDQQLEVVNTGGVIVGNGKILKVGYYALLETEALRNGYEFQRLNHPAVLLPAFVDAHTHICFGGNRSKDYALRVAGASYEEILQAGGGIHDSVLKTRQASQKELVESLNFRAHQVLSRGVATCEVKTGYGLDLPNELKMLKAIREVAQHDSLELLPTCLSAHICPKEFSDPSEYLTFIIHEILPVLKAEHWTNRVDIFVDKNAFSVELARPFLENAQQMGFDLTVHADQFSTGGSRLAVEVGARSADHLEASTEKEIELLAKSNTVAMVLPGASLGLGIGFAPARQLLDAGANLAIASDWNPGSAPMGDLLTQAALLGVYQKLTTAETLAAITFRAAHALGMDDRGVISEGKCADLVAFPLTDYREILYYQGSIRPSKVWKKGKEVFGI